MTVKKHKLFGFTIIEVLLFLAISGALFAGVVASSRRTIAEQRYNDSVQDFADFLRGIYASTSNPQSSSDTIGTSIERAIYGYVLIFGNENGVENGITVDYHLITGAANMEGASTDVLNTIKEPSFNAKLGDKETYRTRWDAKIQKKNGDNYNGSVLVVHSPTGSGIGTYISNNPVNKDNIIQNAQSPDEDIVFCIKSEDSWTRRGVKINKNGQNSSAISIISPDDEACR